jgi:long-chain acyl-CoA synthetase
LLGEEAKMNLANNLVASAKAHPQRVALKLDGDERSYRAFDAASARVAGLLRARGVAPGDRVGLMLPNGLEYPILYYGILRAGASVVPMNVLFKRGEVGYQMRDCSAAVLFAAEAFAEAAEAGAAAAGAGCVLLGPGDLDRLLVGEEPLADPVERDEKDTAVILYTSGTTGRPKGAELTHANLTRNAKAARKLFDLDDRSVLLGALPMFHSFGQTCALNASVLSGAMLSVVPRFDAEKALSTMQRDRVTVFLGVPTMYSALYHHRGRNRYDVTSLRLCVSGGASLPVELLQLFEAAFDCPIIEGYGLSETSPLASFNHRDRPRKAGSIGTPIEGVEMKLVDEEAQPVPVGEVGEIWIRGHNVMKGYWNRPEATAEAITRDGWFRSGDLARVDEQGYFYIVDRKKDMIIRGGFNIYPRELEEVLYQHPSVREVAVVAVPHPTLGEEVGAAVVTKPGTRATVEELREFVKGQVAAYKYPRYIWFVDELPKTATGKILKREIAAPIIL